ncbi:MAG: MarR family transcriptional regulator [Pseudolabrys sp.]|nr:MarR family transcriptional regulator [Pseudolabrys sp.]
MRAQGSDVAAVRRFNRFYTKQIGVLRKDYLASPFSLPEARVLYEMFSDPGLTAREIATRLDLDEGYLSRLLRAFEKRGLIARKTSEKDARQSHLSLTAKGRQAFAPIERRSQASATEMLGKLGVAEQARVVDAMTTIESLLEGVPAKHDYTLRQARIGDFGWIVSRHAELYWQEYKWGEPFEGLCAGIVSDFCNNHDPKRERCWIAEMHGERVGTVMLVNDKGTARLRLLLVDPKVRGMGLGQRLVDECVSFARKAGYKNMTLWTHEALAAARKTYVKAGFTLTSSEKKKSWGQPVVAEYWDLKL